MEIQQFLATHSVAVAVVAMLVATVILYALSGLNNKKESEKSDDDSGDDLKENANATKVKEQKKSQPSRKKDHHHRVHQHSTSISCQAVVGSFRGHGEVVSDFDISPNGCHLVSVSPGTCEYKHFFYF